MVAPDPEVSMETLTHEELGLFIGLCLKKIEEKTATGFEPFRLGMAIAELWKRIDRIVYEKRK